MNSAHHVNDGDCPKCDEIIDLYEDFDEALRLWFKYFQSRHPEAHCSCAGRGKAMQEAYVASAKGLSKAHYGRSAHNYNAALDIFVMLKDNPNIYEPKWFTEVLKPNLESWMTWYGEPDSDFFELPHVELKDWVELVNEGHLQLVE